MTKTLLGLPEQTSREIAKNNDVIPDSTKQSNCKITVFAKSLWGNAFIASNVLWETLSQTERRRQTTT